MPEALFTCESWQKLPLGGQSELAIFFRFFWQFFSGFHFASFACVWHPIRVENRCPKMEPYNRLWLDYYAVGSGFEARSASCVVVVVVVVVVVTKIR